jgi:AraC family transcriptional regulator
MKRDTKINYQERINKVLHYINCHLEEDLDLSKLSELSNFSMFHFHRIIRAYLNESLGSYIVRLRLEKGAGLLVQNDLPVNEIAYKIGYETPAAFTKAFKIRFGVSPSEYRSRDNNNTQNINYLHNQLISYVMELKPKIKEIKPIKVIYIQSFGKYGGLKTKESWEKLFSFMKYNKLWSFSMQCIGLSHDDPSITDPERCRYDACISIKKDIKPAGEIGTKTIEGGKYAIFTYKGPYDNLGIVYNNIYREWLPKSNFELREQPPFDVYLKNPDKTKPENLKTEIYVPIK